MKAASLLNQINTLERKAFKALKEIAKQHDKVQGYLFPEDDQPEDDSHNIIVGFTQTHIIIDGKSAEEAYPMSELNVYEALQLLREVENNQKRKP